nr:hypothetical protein [Deltaproteobacteria bacterium]
LTLQTWYPTLTPASDVPIEALEAEPIQAQYAGLLAAAPACPRRTARVALDAPIAAGAFPVVAFSHCHNCSRLSNAATAERLASHGFVVLAVDHDGNTLWEHLAGEPDANLDTAFLEVRAGDIRFALDQLPSLPIAGSLDLESIGMFGHSFGAVTTGRVAQLDPRIRAAAALAAPMENPLIAGVQLSALTQPLLFLVAQEDNSITELGNIFIRNNFRDAPGTAWKIEVADAGHWSVSDFAGLVDLFAPGCGDDTRQTDDLPFTYLDPEIGRAITAAYVTAFFRATLEDDPGARAYLGQQFPDGIVDVEHH